MTRKEEERALDVPVERQCPECQVDIPEGRAVVDIQASIRFGDVAKEIVATGVCLTCARKSFTGEDIEPFV